MLLSAKITELSMNKHTQKILTLCTCGGTKLHPSHSDIRARGLSGNLYKMGFGGIVTAVEGYKSLGLS
jgi:hypothetical protein